MPSGRNCCSRWRTSSSASPTWNRTPCCRSRKHACGVSRCSSTRTGTNTTSRCPGSKPAITYRRERVYRRQTINEKIEEALADAEENSVGIGVDAAITTQFAKRTKGDDPLVDNRAYALASADLFFTAGIAQNTVFFADIVALSGSPPDAEIPSLTLLNGYTARLERQNELNLREVWLRTELFGQRLALTTGRLDLTNYFDANAFSNDESTQFLSDALVNNQMLGLSSQRHRRRRGIRSQERLPPQVRLAAEQQRRDQPVGLAVHVERGRLHVHPLRAARGQLSALVPNRQHVAGDTQGRRHQRRPEAHATPSACSRATARRTWRTTAAITTGAPASASRTASSSIRRTPGASATRRWSWSPGDREKLVEGYYNLLLTERLRLSFHLSHALETPAGGEKFGYLLPGVRLQAAF